MRLLVAGGATLLILLLSMDAFACQDDRDCPDSFRCVWLFGELEGLCERGVTHWDEPNRVSPANKNTTGGKRCDIDSDCDAGMTCMVEGSPDHRICRRK